MSIGKNIAYLRDVYSISQRELAKKIFAGRMIYMWSVTPKPLKNAHPEGQAFLGEHSMMRDIYIINQKGVSRKARPKKQPPSDDATEGEDWQN